MLEHLSISISHSSGDMKNTSFVFVSMYACVQERKKKKRERRKIRLRIYWKKNGKGYIFAPIHLGHFL